MSLDTSLNPAETILWTLRALQEPSILRRAAGDPVLFASWYAFADSAITWPEAVVRIQEREAAKKLSLEKALSLLQKMGHMGLDTLQNSETVKRILTGYAVHDWVSTHRDEFAELLSSAIEGLQQVVKLQGFQGTRLPPKILEFSRVLGLNATESSLLSIAYVSALSRQFSQALENMLSTQKTHFSQLWCRMLDCSMQELTQALSSKSVLRTSRLLVARRSPTEIPRLSDFWVQALHNELESVFDALLKPLSIKPGAGIPARLAEQDQALAVQILQNSCDSKQAGVNLLLYGADSFEKRTQLAQLLGAAGKDAYVLNDFDDVSKDLPTIAFVAQRFLFERKGSTAVLVLERPSAVLERLPSEYLRALFGLEVDNSHIAPMDEMLLSTNPAPVVWTCASVSSLSEECVSRFVFHAPLKKARREERRSQMERYVAELKLTKATQRELLSLEDVSARQLETALVASKLSGATTRKDKEAALVRAVKRSLSALQRSTSSKTKECVTEYSLKYINHAGKFGPEQILKALQLRQKGSICLYGPPGTGKTQFVEHLAQQLGIRLIVKRASDLLSKWVGENEKNIAAMFEEAENEEALLFLDEGDSFLRDRSLAQAGWEVSKVNELLQHMERYEGIFIVATNLFRGLDAAALRRFTFKLELRALKPEQRWDMFVAETGLKDNAGEYTKAQKDGWRGSLALMHQLAAGDFATVKRQCILLGESLTPSQWVEQLQIECDVKLSGQAQEPTVSESDVKVPAKGGGHLH
jgi:hypothetical protein